MKYLTKILREQRGSQLLEFILTMPLLMALLVFSFDQFTVMYNKQRALTAAYKAGRIAAVQPSSALANYYAEELGEEELEQCISMEKGSVSISGPYEWAKGSHFEAKAKVTFRLLWSGELREIRESYTMMIENGSD